jgi:hypothetical protein
MKSMKIGGKLLIFLMCILLLSVAWIATLNKETDEEKQAKLVIKAENYLEDKIYIRAEPLLDEALTFQTDKNAEIEDMLKNLYISMINKEGYPKKYEALLNTLMSRENASAGIFLEAANYYLNNDELESALVVLKQGAKVTNDEAIIRLYESQRYAYKTGRSTYENVSDSYGGYRTVTRDGLFGVASDSGGLVIPCVYDKVSTIAGGYAIVKSGSTISGINFEGNRVSLEKNGAIDFNNFSSNNRLFVKYPNGYGLEDYEFTFRNKYQMTVYEETGMFTSGIAPVKINGKWGVVNASDEILITNEYDEIIRDNIGRITDKTGKNIFALKNGKTILLQYDSENNTYKETDITFDNARPFNGSYAAVCIDGKWGFVDQTGKIVIECQYEDALSFGQHLAAVKIDGLWGYINTYGDIAIEPQFVSALSFSSGSAPVIIDEEDGWQFITLIEKNI